MILGTVTATHLKWKQGSDIQAALDKVTKDFNTKLSTQNTNIEELKRTAQTLTTELGTKLGFKEFESMYVPIESAVNGALKSVPFTKEFSNTPIVICTLDIQDKVGRAQYIQNVARTGFEVATNYGASLKDVWYFAFIK
ncbi:hypothetical protein [Neisseria iguanae]|uniref:Uncharacterized protein n=1 Tax=Neisseria iguanae TaxID=90242 RepID=A0A2P7U1J6_9NEIS|nr:hypothetical protein [Neisseria iguanae]PSJ80805.1 hypothetical protein C7N83_04070 [Neisseria iguanae]